MAGLEGRHSAIELRPQIKHGAANAERGAKNETAFAFAVGSEFRTPGSELKLVVRGGFEPPKAEPADLQSAPFDRSGT